MCVFLAAIEVTKTVDVYMWVWVVTEPRGIRSLGAGVTNFVSYLTWVLTILRSSARGVHSFNC